MQKVIFSLFCFLIIFFQTEVGSLIDLIFRICTHATHEHKQIWYSKALKKFNIKMTLALAELQASSQFANFCRILCPLYTRSYVDCVITYTNQVCKGSIADSRQRFHYSFLPLCWNHFLYSLPISHDALKAAPNAKPIHQINDASVCNVKLHYTACSMVFKFNNLDPTAK